MALRPFLATALATALVAGCGDGGEPASTPAEQHEPEPTQRPESQPEPESDIGRAFVEFARGGDVPPMRDQVALFLGNALTGVVTPASRRTCRRGRRAPRSVSTPAGPARSRPCGC